jgi:hypothetical protein
MKKNIQEKKRQIFGKLQRKGIRGGDRNSIKNKSMVKPNVLMLQDVAIHFECITQQSRELFDTARQSLETINQPRERDCQFV